MPEFAHISNGIANTTLGIAASMCEAQALGLTFQLSQVDETPKIQLTPEQFQQIRTLAMIEMARELARQIRSLQQP